MVIVNTCGFLDSMRKSLWLHWTGDEDNGRVIGVTPGCMGGRAGTNWPYPNILAVAGPHQYEQVVEAVHDAVPPAR